MLVSGLQLFQSKAQAVHITNLSVNTQANMNVHTLGHKYHIRPGAVKLVFGGHWMHLIYMHQ